MNFILMHIHKYFIKPAFFLITSVSFLLLLTSCGLITPVARLFGVDTYDYESEEIIVFLETDSEFATELAEMTRILSVDSILLPEFADPKTVLPNCTDAVLMFMLRSNYAKYNGNKKILSTVELEYPQLQVTTVITASDFENTVYKYFGGNEVIKHRSGGIFTYLDRADAYTSAGQIYPDETEITILSLEETENSYRLTFYNQLDGINSPVYLAVLIKRTDGDGSVYFRSLKQIADGRKTAPNVTDYN